MTGTPDLAADAVVKRFGDHIAVDALSFTVERGSFFSILGPSGCGKTTLLRMIAGFIAPDSGGIAIGGKSMAGVAPNHRPVNMVFQQFALFPMMSVGENVAYGLARRGVGRAERRRKTEEMLSRVGLGGSAEKRVDELSGGQRQRVAIARSLVLEPTLLLLDELEGEGRDETGPCRPCRSRDLFQLRNGDGLCWEAVYSAPAIRNQTDQFKDKGD